MKKLDFLAFVSAMRGPLYQCGQIALKLKGKTVKRDKAPDSSVQLSTAVGDVDELCQEIILMRAAEVTPWIEIRSEEQNVCPKAIRELFEKNSSRFTLVIDPLDGTDEFFRAGNEFGHMVGIHDKQSGRMSCGMIFIPEEQVLYFAIRGMGAFTASGLFGEVNPIARPLKIPKSVRNVKRLTEEDHRAFELSGFVQAFPENRSSAVDGIRVATGEIGATFMRGFHGHDTGIPGILIEELGGAVLGENGKSVMYDSQMSRMPLVISSLNPDYARLLWEAQAKERAE